jgi:steroid delta-isomerase-like uncharacterized protein
VATEEDNKDLVRRYIEDFFSDGHLDNPGETYFSSDFVAHTPDLAEPVQGYEKYVSQGEQLMRGFTPVENTIEDMIASGDKVVVRSVYRGRHTGLLFGLPPTHKEATMEGIGIFRIANGKIAESWGIVDALEVFQQLGVLPAVGQRNAAVP